MHQEQKHSTILRSHFQSNAGLLQWRPKPCEVVQGQRLWARAPPWPQPHGRPALLTLFLHDLPCYTMHTLSANWKEPHYIVCKLKSHTTLSANWKHSQEINTMEERLWSLPTDNPYNRLPHPSSKPVLCNGKVFVWMESRWIHVQIHFNSPSSSIWPCSLPPLPRNEMIGWTTHCPS